MTTTRGTTFTTTMWVVNRVHGNTTNGWANATPAFGTSFTQRTKAVLGVRDFAQRCTAFRQYFTHFTGAKTQGHVHTFTSDQLCRSTSRTSDLCAFTWLQFDAVYGATNWNVTQLKSVARLDWCQSTCNQLVASTHAFRGNDVAALAVCVKQQSNVSSTVWIVFNTLDGGSDAILVVATEIDQTIMLLMATTDMTGSNTAIVVTTTSLRFFLEQRCVRSAFMQLLVDHLDHKTAARGSRFAFNDCHDAPLPYSALLLKSRSWPG
ncbi:hypothetical protein KPSA1_00577 [Pseudomonas syringae pv. actinidiae]|uniref:Uncharacterized protein n=1 Tax=Pseudomonas syringae pv. actinidiae TaxID=103796 RepID=A0A2V0QNQ1_PSESF|nr:hypothetical protein KPSA1_00577 [Pseudomonas syringae pv. actinidiae]GBH14756.1 hypothetical protein KPSA3_00668 [Pseudomonas syringae pv. actinidiae]